MATKRAASEPTRIDFGRYPGKIPLYGDPVVAHYSAGH
jgi:hypothetical protein